MKPNLFHSINDALAERFPLLPRVRRSFYGLLLFCGLFLFIQGSNENIHVAVIPATAGIYDNKTITIFGKNTIHLHGNLVIADPTFLQKILLTDTTTQLDIISLIIMATISIVVIRITPKIYQQNLFRKDISSSIRLIGYIVFLHTLVRYLVDILYAPAVIERLTNHQFTTHRVFPVWLCAEAYIGLMILAIGSAFRRGMEIRQEQDLTI